MNTHQPIPAVQYLRMSTEHQQYSTANQASAIAEYASTHGFVITRTYSDPAKSGLWLRNRPGLRELLQDVTSGKISDRAILVYDVTRWGRFQDTDEAAHYEFLCKSAGIPVHYCAEPFPNDGSMPSLIMKALKRVMAGEYSRELGTKVFAGQKRLAELGFKMGGQPGYGLRRMLVSADRKPKQLLAFGERKSITTDRVVLVLGPAQEVERVREIFKMFIEDGMSLKGIARELNRKGIVYRNGNKWTHYIVRRTLSDPKYMGCNVFNRRTMRLGTRCVWKPQSEWIVVPGAHQALVDPSTFAKAQNMLANFTIRKTNDQILEDLKRLLALRGRLSTKIIHDAPGMPGLSTFRQRFGGIRQAYKLIGYAAGGYCGPHPWTWTFREELMSRIQRIFPNGVYVIEGGKWRSRLKLRNGLLVSVLIAPSYRKGRMWRVDAGKREYRSVTLVARLDTANREFQDFFVFTRLPSPRTIYLNRNDKRLGVAIKLTDLSQLCDVVEKVRLERKRRNAR